MKKSARLPAWDLSDLYKSIKDSRLDRDVKQAGQQAAKFRKRYRGKVDRVIKSPKDLIKALHDYESIQQDLAKPVVYAGLVFSADQSQAAHGAFLQKMRSSYTEIQQLLVFFELELLALPVSRLKKFTRTASLKQYQNYLAKLLAQKNHVLTEDQEKVSSDKALTGRNAFVRLYGEELTSMRFPFGKRGRVKMLGESEILPMLHSPERQIRKQAAAGFTTGLKENSRRLTYIFNTLIQDKQISDKLRSYENMEDTRHLSNQIEPRMVDSMVQTVVKNYKIVQDFYKFKAKLLNIKRLTDYDRYAPIGNEKTNYTFNEARVLVLDAFSQFSSDFAGLAEEFFERGWIDAAPRTGKAGGAYCSFVTPDRHPYVFINYRNNLRDVFTLAHELGHAVHARLMQSQGYLNFDIPLTIAETASVFSEMLLFDHLKEVVNPKQKLAIYVSRIENSFATSFRQVSLYRFEQSFHKARREQGEQTTEQINQLWRKSQLEMFGNSIELTQDYDSWWSYISHFINSPFYVYSYAFGELLSMALFETYKQKGSLFADKFLQFLSAGGSQAPKELCAGLGVNLASGNFWQKGLVGLNKLVQEVKSM